MTLLLHPGFHKTGTTWLQETVFAEGRLFRALLTHHEIDELLVRPHDLEFDEEAARTRIAGLRESIQSGITDVISSEILSGTMFSGSRECLRLAERLRSVIGEARILLTVRSQQSIMRSVYLQYVKRGGRLSIQDFIDYSPEPGYFWFNLRLLEFDRLAGAYAGLFGADNVLVLPQELLKTDRGAYLSHLFAFADIPEDGRAVALDFGTERGVSPPASGIPLLRTANIFQPGPLNPEAPGFLSFIGRPLHRLAYRWRIGIEGAERALNTAIEARLSGRYAMANRRLQEYAPVDLAALGYEMEP